MSGLATVRAEIKEWERTWRAKHGRDPTIDEIRANTHIAAKYRTYKMLSKAAASQPAPKLSTSSQSPATPSRPSRARDHDHATLSTIKSRVITAAAPVSSFNPFSPQKAKGKEREKPEPRIPQPVFNPFASPSKSRPNAQASQAASLRTALFQSPERGSSPPAPSTAVTRARKRLRGEPVSPSPSKEKRRRTGSQTTINFPKLALGGSKPSLGARQDDQDDSDDDHEDTFIDDSPVKASSSRTFSLLFEDAQSTLSADIFGLKKDANKPVGQKLFAAADNTAKPIDSKLLSASQPAMKRPRAQSRASSSLASTGSQTRVATPAATTPYESEDEANDNSEEGSSRRSRSPLLPPSPPPASATTSRAAGPPKRKANPKAFANRKKAKLASHCAGSDDESSSEGSSGLKAKVKRVDRPQAMKAVADDDDMDFEFDPLLDGHRTAAAIPVAATQADDKSVLEVDLPDKFRDVLDLETIHWKEHAVEEDKVVDSLIYGRRTTFYDAKKGEIWDVGEDEGGGAEGDGENVDNEWEDEPVPWEVAEL